jgi:PAS domain S-box-containing protein
MKRDEQQMLEQARQEAVATLEQLARPFSPVVESDGTNGPARGQPLPPRRAVDPFAWSESALRSLLQALPDAMVIIDQEGVIVHVNEQLGRLFGYTAKELLGEAIELLIPERFRDGHVGHRARYFLDPRSRPMGIGLELHGRHKSGTEVPVEISLSPLQTDRGQFAIGIIRDITARKKEEAKFRTLVENIPAVSFFAPLDESNPELYVSPQIEAMLGFSQQEWLSDPVLWYRQLHPEDRERWNKQFAPTCAAGDAFREVYRFVAKDGGVVWVHGAANLVRDEDGHPLFLQGVAFDITEQKQQAEQLRQLNAELEQRVAERTLALQQLLHALEDKTSELEQFAYVSSHDLRQPLRSLVNYPQKLLKEYGSQLDQQALEWLQKTIAGAERLRRLIDDLLQYSRVVRRDRVFEPTDCGEVFKIVCANLQADIEQAGATITASPLPTVPGYQAHLIILFQNLIGNAIKFRAPDRPPQIEVSAHRQGEDWFFQVRDNGIGMEEKYWKRIFELGERLHSEAKYPGTGFGLAICEKIVRGHGGRIWVTSKPGQGSCFSFTLSARSVPQPSGQHASGMPYGKGAEQGNRE